MGSWSMASLLEISPASPSLPGNTSNLEQVSLELAQDSGFSFMQLLFPLQIPGVPLLVCNPQGNGSALHGGHKTDQQTQVN